MNSKVKSTFDLIIFITLLELEFCNKQTNEKKHLNYILKPPKKLINILILFYSYCSKDIVLQLYDFKWLVILKHFLILFLSIIVG